MKKGFTIVQPLIFRRVVCMIKKYIYWKNPRIYAIYYFCNNTIYFNLNFSGKTKLYILK